MTIRPRGGNLHENRWRATARPRVYSARIDVRCERVCAWAYYKPRELANGGWITVAERAACGRQTRHDHRSSVRFKIYIHIDIHITCVYRGRRRTDRMGKLKLGGGGRGNQKKSPTNDDSRSAREVVERTRQILAAADRNVSCSSYIIIYTREATRCRGDAAVYFSRSRDTETYATRTTTTASQRRLPAT